MTARTYDVILSVASAAAFQAGNNIIGNTTLTTGIIASVDKVKNTLKVKLSNLQQEFSATEFIHSNIIVMGGTSANGYIYSTALPFQANTMSGNTTTARSNIISIAPSAFIAEKNSFTQNPVVRLYSIYYPGDWYPPNPAGNPTGSGAGYAWPSIFPIRLAEIIGDKTEDISYNVIYGGVSYVPYPLNLTGLEQGSDGKINELSLSIYNTDNIISYLVENPYLAGYNTSNSVQAIVNGELVSGIDPNTVVGSSYYNAAVVAYYGTSNAMFDKTRSDAVNGTWNRQKMDSRDLLGAAVEIKTTFANFLDYWPEYALATAGSNDKITVTSTLPYRVGDVITTGSASYSNSTIISISADATINLDKPISKYIYLGAQEVNPEGIAFKPDGTKCYVTGTNQDRVKEYNLTSPWDISTATYLQQFSVSTQEATPRAVQFNPAGNYMFVVGTTNDNIYRYTLSTAWNVTTASLSQTFNIAPYEGNTGGLAFDAEGTNAYITGFTSDKVFQFNIGTPWDLTTATYTQNLSIGTVEGAATDIFFKPDGTSFYLIGSATDQIFQYNLANTWDISTATYYTSKYVGMFDTNPGMLSFSQLGDTVYFGGYVSDNLQQAALTIPWNLNSIDYSLPVGTPLYIINPGADTSSYLFDNYKIDQLESLGEQVATFGLVSWLQYFKIVTPKRKYYKNTCQWLYKGPECQYPGPSLGNTPIAIPGTTPTKYVNTNPIAANNTIMPVTGNNGTDLATDVCAKSLTACSLRNNDIHFGGFPGVGRTVPQM